MFNENLIRCAQYVGVKPKVLAAYLLEKGLPTSELLSENELETARDHFIATGKKIGGKWYIALARRIGVPVHNLVRYIRAFKFTDYQTFSPEFEAQVEKAFSEEGLSNKCEVFVPTEDGNMKSMGEQTVTVYVNVCKADEVEEPKPREKKLCPFMMAHTTDAQCVESKCSLWVRRFNSSPAGGDICAFSMNGK
jgi:hypothetical protein